MLERGYVWILGMESPYVSYYTNFEVFKYFQGRHRQSVSRQGQSIGEECEGACPLSSFTFYFYMRPQPIPYSQTYSYLKTALDVLTFQFYSECLGQFLFNIVFALFWRFCLCGRLCLADEAPIYYYASKQ